MRDLSKWTPCPRPQRQVMEGRYCRLEPLHAERHGSGLYDVATAADADERFRWLPETRPESRSQFQSWLQQAEQSADPLYFVVIDVASGTIGGRQTLMRHDPANGVIEIGHIFWGSKIAQRPVTTEAFYLFAKWVFDVAGYRRFEWKCNNANAASKRAAERFGMTHEGLFRQAAIVKGENRDTAWFSLLDHEWPNMRAAFEAWLAPDNFDHEGWQRQKLQAFKAQGQDGS